MGLLARAKHYLHLPLSRAEEVALQKERELKETRHINTVIQLTQNSAAAHEFIKPKKVTIRQQVIEFIKARGAHGATTEEVLEAFPNIKFQSLAPRVTELHQDGITVSSGSRLNGSGLLASVWVINPEAFV